MKILETVLTVAVIIYFLVYIILALNCKKPFKTLILIALGGLAALAVVNLTSRFTGVYIPVNPYTVGISASGGIVGTVALLIIKLIFGV